MGITRFPHSSPFNCLFTVSQFVLAISHNIPTRSLDNVICQFHIVSLTYTVSRGHRWNSHVSLSHHHLQKFNLWLNLTTNQYKSSENHMKTREIRWWFLVKFRKSPRNLPEKSSFHPPLLSPTRFPRHGRHGLQRELGAGHAGSTWQEGPMPMGIPQIRCHQTWLAGKYTSYIYLIYSYL